MVYTAAFAGQVMQEEGTVSVEIRRLPHSNGLALPAYETPGAAGMDIRAALTEPLEIAPGCAEMVPTGFEMAIPRGYEGQVRPRSGLAVRNSILVPNSPGTIDSDYRGELKVILLNMGPAPFMVEHGMRIAQLVVSPVVKAHWIEVEQLPPTTRGDGGFGHTGVS